MDSVGNVVRHPKQKRTIKKAFNPLSMSATSYQIRSISTASQASRLRQAPLSQGLPIHKPSINCRFCTAAPLAPLPRLSRRATSTAWR